MAENQMHLINQLSPMDGVIVGGQPGPEAVSEAKEAGYRTIVDLCAPNEYHSYDRDQVESLGFRYINIPISGQGDLCHSSAQRLHEVLEDESARPVIVHCASGARVGALFTLRACWVLGHPAEHALHLGRQAGLRPGPMEQLVRTLIEENGEAEPSS